MLKPSTVYLIDASIYFFRYYYSMPGHWQSEDGFDTAAVYGYSRWLLKLIATQKPCYVAACFDESLESCFRNDIYPGYKSSRVLPDEGIVFQLNACKKITELMGVAVYTSTCHEADDLLAALAVRCRRKGLSVCVLSRDKDLGQLVSSSEDCMWDFPQGPVLNRDALTEKLGVRPEQIADLLALIGDASDDIPGVPGIGSKTAGKLLQRFSNWSEMKMQLNQVAIMPFRGALSVAKKLDEYREQIDMALALTTLDDGAELGRRLRLRPNKPRKSPLSEYCLRLGFGEGFQTSINRVFK